MNWLDIFLQIFAKYRIVDIRTQLTHILTILLVDLCQLIVIALDSGTIPAKILCYATNIGILMS